MPISALAPLGLGSWPSWNGELWSMPGIPMQARSYPLIFRGRIMTGSVYRPQLRMTLRPEFPLEVPYGKPLPLTDATEDLPFIHDWVVTYFPAEVPPQFPTQVAVVRSGSAEWPYTVQSLTVEWTSGGDGGAGSVRLNKVVEGVPLTALAGTAFAVTATDGTDVQSASLYVDADGEIIPEMVSFTTGQVVSFTEDLSILPGEIGGRRVSWAPPVFSPSEVTILEDDVVDVTVTNRVQFLGGLWPVRQRQAVAGASWPLRQRQNGAHSGSWPLRQRQQRL